MCVGRYAAKDMRNERSEMEHNRSEMPANIRITNTHPSGMRFRYQWAIWCCRIPLECIILVYLLQAFRKDSISLRSITSFLHTCLHTSNPLGFFTIITKYIITGTTCISSPIFKDRVELLRERRSCDFFLLLRLFLFKLGVVLGGNLGEIVNFVG